MNLNPSLIAILRPNAIKENIVLWRDYRITILDSRLFRIEKDIKHDFIDDATLSVWFRDMPKREYSVCISDNECRIDTGVCSLIVANTRKDCRVVFDGISHTIDNTDNLKGTYRTLDNCDGDIWVYEWVGKDAVPVDKKIELENGVCSRKGVAVMDDSGTPFLFPDGTVHANAHTGSDEYVFAFGHDYRGAVRSLFSICGRPPVLPDYVFGNWWSRYHAYSDCEYLGLLNKFEEENIPFTVVTIDMDWHYSFDVDDVFGISEKGLNTDYYGGNNGWTGYTWNKNLFPDYRKFLKQIKKKRYAVTLNLHPALGVRWWEKQYYEFARAIGVDPETKKKIDFDITDNRFINAYFEILHKPYEKEGVDFWWIDWQQGQKCAINGLDPLWSLNHYHFLGAAAEGKNPVILSRYAGVGSHRYPLGFSGDTYMSWKTLDYLPYFTATATNIGYTWWSHDIGGHQKGVKDDELYVRFVQFGVFSPVNRLHCMDSEIVTKSPDAYGAAGAVAEKFLRLRHKLIPFLYSENVKTSLFGNALIEPLYYRWDVEQAYKLKNEYIFGNSLLVAPVTEKISDDGFSRTKVYLPEGKWTDIFTGDEYVVGRNGREFVAMRDLSRMPVFAESGTILPLSLNPGNSVEIPKILEVQVFSGNGEYVLYEKDGSNTVFCVSEEINGNFKRIVFTIAQNDKHKDRNRKYLIKFRNVKDPHAKILVNGKLRKSIPYSECLLLKIPHAEKIKIEITYAETSEIKKLLTRTARVITEIAGKNEEKQEIYNDLINSRSVAEFKEKINGSSFSDALKTLLTETV